MSTSEQTSTIPLGPSPTAPPIFSLSNELLAAVTAAGQEGRSPEYPLKKVFKSEWALSHVCRRFRDVLLGTPTLWTLVEVGSGAGVAEILRLYLERSRSCKLWAVVHVTDSRNDLDRVAEYLSPIIPQTDRIRGLRIVALASSMCAVLDAFRDVAASALVHLELRTTVSPSNPLQLFAGGPPRALTFLRLANIIPQLPIPQWATSITHLELGRREFEEGQDGSSVCAALIAQCPALVHLFIDLDQRRSTSHMSRITSPSLRSLHLEISSSESFLAIIGLFNTPALTDLTVVHAHGDQICLLFDSTSLPDSSFPALTSLSFAQLGHCTCEQHAGICAAVQPIPSPPRRLFPVLLSLTLINEYFTAHIVEQILGPAAAPWPLLETLTLFPKPDELDAVRSALHSLLLAKRPQTRVVPKLRVSPTLFQQLASDPDSQVDVELCDPTEAVAALESYPRW